MSHFESAQENVSCQYVSFSIIILHEATPSSCRFEEQGLILYSLASLCQKNDVFLSFLFFFTPLHGGEESALCEYESRVYVNLAVTGTRA